jgi:hypothetical protein
MDVVRGTADGGTVAKVLCYKSEGRWFDSWTIRMCFRFWPTQRHGAVLWILAHMVHYRTQNRGRLTLADYADFVRRTRWKIYHVTPAEPRRELPGDTMTYDHPHVWRHKLHHASALRALCPVTVGPLIY